MLVRYHLLIVHPAIDIEAEYTLLLFLEGLLGLNPRPSDHPYYFGIWNIDKQRNRVHIKRF